MQYTEADISARFHAALQEANVRLSEISVANGRQPKLRGLNGWVFEQTIRTCIEDELRILGISCEISEQVSIQGRAKVDLLLDDVAFEIKAAGLFGITDAEKYRNYRKQIETGNREYLYVTAYETHLPFVDLAIDIFGYDRAFFLDKPGDWERLISFLRQKFTTKQPLPSPVP